MKQMLIASFLIMVFLFPQSTQAQLFEKLKKRVERTVERKIENKAEEKTEQAMDSILTEKRGKKGNEEVSSEENDVTNDIMKDIMNQKDVTTESSYTFPITATMLVTDYSKRKSEEMKMIQSYGENSILNVMEENPNPIIIDMKNEAAIILNSEEKIAQIMSLSWLHKMMGQQPISEEENEQATVVKTGLTKTINGYLCHEYNITHEKIKINAWYAPDVDFNYQDYMRGFSKMMSKKKGENPMLLLNDGYGYVMEMTAFEKEKKVTNMKVIDLSEVTKHIDLSNYSVQKMF